MASLDNDAKRALRTHYEQRHPDKGIVGWKCGDDLWVGMSRDVQATYNATKFQLELGSLRNKRLQAAYNADPASVEWCVLALLDYEDPSADYDEDLELLLMEVMDQHPDAMRLSTRRFC